MFGATTSDDYQPLTWVGRHPVYVTTLLIAVHIFAAIVACFLGGAGRYLAFDSALLWQRGEFWQLATYAFVHSPSALLWFAVEMYMLFVFGREVERFIGRNAFIVLYLSLLFAPTVLLSLWGLAEQVGIAGMRAGLAAGNDRADGPPELAQATSERPADASAPPAPRVLVVDDEASVVDVFPESRSCR